MKNAHKWAYRSISIALAMAAIALLAALWRGFPNRPVADHQPPNVAATPGTDADSRPSASFPGAQAATAEGVVLPPPPVTASW